MRSYDYSMGPARPRSSLFLTHAAMSCSSPLKNPRRGWCVAEQQGMFITYASAPGRTASDRGEICGSTGGRICKARSRSSQSIPEHERICAGLDGRCAAALGEQRARPSGISYGSTSSSGPPTVSVDSQRSRASWGTIKDSKALSDFEAFRLQYGKANTFYRQLAEKRIEELKKEPGQAKAEAQAEAK